MAQNLLTEAANPNQLSVKYPALTVRSLDYSIWSYMSSQSNRAQNKSNGIKYHKLVRDRIPEIIEASGKKSVTEILDDDEYLRVIDFKLDEELAEYHQD